jgi:hypothetical protein
MRMFFNRFVGIVNKSTLTAEFNVEDLALK